MTILEGPEMKSLRIIFLLFPFLTQADEITVAVEAWPPYVQKDHTGVADTIVQCALTVRGHRLVYKSYPWPRIYSMIKNGLVDISYPWNMTGDRVKEVLFSEPLFEAKEVFVYLKGNDFKWNTANDLKKYSIGALIGYSHTELLLKNKIPIQLVKKESQLFGLLFSKRIDAFPINFSILTSMLKTMPTEEVSRIALHEKAFSNNMLRVITTNNARGRFLIDELSKGVLTPACRESEH
ncbi:transporter substrate-binding domain-containing protein [Aeromonas sp. 2MA4]|uniref:substrate-binding periplasmic protein n=2 Tax=unclassified Aeromonas TaxID=257493 RepID=UPI0023DDC0BE|nr:transporter substrate-binding domain-containing protein [Aeromonas sp. 2MA4]MDF2392668.1 transporter substrate-binding domain-containing protein [Aeromonas sp. 2MA4]